MPEGNPRPAISRFRLAAVAVAIALLMLLAAACGDGSSGSPTPEPDPQADPEPQVEEVTGDLVIYSGRREELVGPIIQRFEDETSINVKVRYGSNGGLIGTIFEEGSNSPADVFFGSDPGALGALSDRFLPLPSSILSRVDTSFRSREGNWVGVSGRARVVVYNTGALTEADLPDSIFDFTDPRWKGRIGWAPTNGSFQAMVTAMRLTAGEEPTRRWLEGIKANDPREYANNVATVRATADDEIDVGFVNHYYLHRFLAEEGESFAARNYYLKGGDPGAVVLVAGAGILETSDNVPAAERFIEFLLEQEAQQYFSDETFEYPLVEGVEPQAGLVPLADIDVPDLDLSSLSDLEGTLELLRDAGVIP